MSKLAPETIFQEVIPEFDIPLLAQKAVAELRKKSPFVLWLKGDLGAGKTTFTRYVLQELGLNKDFPVTSPTFTYLNEYKINDDWYAHIDLYRLIDESDDIDVEDFMSLDYRDFKGFFVEWPNTSLQNTVLAPTHILEIDYDGEARKYIFQRGQVPC